MSANDPAPYVLCARRKLGPPHVPATGGLPRSPPAGGVPRIRTAEIPARKSDRERDPRQRRPAARDREVPSSPTGRWGRSGWPPATGVGVRGGGRLAGAAAARGIIEADVPGRPGGAAILRVASSVDPEHSGVDRQLQLET